MSYKVTKVTDITQKTILENARRWLTIVRYGEYGLVIQPQDDCEYRVEQIIGNPEILKSILGPYYRKYLLGYVPVDKKPWAGTVRETLLSLARSRKIEIPPHAASVKQIIDHLVEKGYEIGLFISRINHLLDEPDFASLMELEYLLENTLNFSVIVFSEKDLTNPLYTKLVDKCSLIFDHIQKFPLYEQEDVRQFIKYNDSMWSMKTSDELEKKIIEACGGYLWLVSHLQRYFRDNPKASFDEAVNDEALMVKLEAIFLKFTKEEQSLILKAAEGFVSMDDKKSQAYSFLKSIRMIKVDNNIATLGIPLLSKIVEKEKYLKKIELKDNRIYVNGNEINGLLTTNENIFLSLLLSNGRKPVSRDLLAQNLWGENWEDKYSDWAIDRLAYRIRHKLSQIGIDEKLLKTQKKKGFIFG